MEALRPEIRFEGVTEVVWKYLRDQNYAVVIKPGERLNENVIAESLAVSTPPLRRLENEWLDFIDSRKRCPCRNIECWRCQTSARLIYFLRSGPEKDPGNFI